jgi:hypothetical protein
MSLRPALLAASTVAAAVGICLALYRWSCGRNRQRLDIAWEVQRGEELASYLEVARRRHEAKQALAPEVVDGQMTLRVAAGHFRRLDETDPGYPAGIPRPTRDERVLCGRVLDFVWEILAREELFAAAAAGMLRPSPPTRRCSPDRLPTSATTLLCLCPSRLRPGPGCRRPRRDEPCRLPPPGAGLAAG